MNKINSSANILIAFFVLFLSFSKLTFSQSLADRYETQQEQQRKHENELKKSKDEKELLSNYRRDIEAGIIGDVISCGVRRFAFVGSYVIKSNDSGKFYFGTSSPGVNDRYSKANGILRWDNENTEYHIQKNKLFMKLETTAEVLLFPCKIIRKESPKSVFNQ